MLFITPVLFHFCLYMQVVPTEEELPELKQDSSHLSSSWGNSRIMMTFLSLKKGERILNVAGGHLVALKCLVCFYYTQTCKNTYIFPAETRSPNIRFNSDKIPVKATVFVDEISK